MPQDLINSLRSVTVWRKGSQRAPHKPLLLLMTLASVQRGDPRQTAYYEIHPRLDALLRDFGPPRESFHPEYPFWRLQNQKDGDFWEIPQREAAIAARGDRLRSGDVSPTILRKVQATGGFTQEVYDRLPSDPMLVNRIAAEILEEHFPPSLHDSLLEAVSMPWVMAGVPSASRRSPEFRRDVIRLYEHRCAMCGFDGRLGHSDLALEAAHIMWHALGGPDDPTNGLLLCSLHHRALDRGAIGITEDRRVLVSQELSGGPQVKTSIFSLGGEALRSPVDPAAEPAQEFMAWHRSEVFREPARPVG